MNAKKQYGKGLSGFILGLLLATAVIAGVLFFLNKSNQKAFKEEAPKELPKPEILTPKGSEPAASTPQQASGAASTPASDVLGGFIREQQASETVEKTEETPPEVIPVPPKPETKPVEKPVQKAKPKAETKPAEKKADEDKQEPKKAAKPTPEQILNSGSIEKAREEARAEAAQKEAERKKERQAQSSEEGGRIVLQMGSFGNRESAEAHRAKLAMMGVSSNIVEAAAGGKSVYRVQSGRMNKEAAQKAQQTLKQNGVDSFARTVK
ncbi:MULTISPECIES: SPOR domain-containing protein [unclassified Neisseria]|uniref:SPOR domain-containing protein n=1 Tax=unclassified Neisseria TaxID=2623750 RepID=UPI002666122E|nr:MULTISPECIES: SPOR domain-containing protein [unclassified Neisseria]MDO1510594.1 SPOR domain-containing protein [Neisseria sp. MVDL19-042950]MDO1516282.1 SPOR domain-containing protein [Neisseria sp. MVDL18-041461]MDO1564246.1 SPOR domain-containing protein [Neisseria sp. MVDL20-010259]